MPHEHGAYGQLVFPLATVLLVHTRPAALAWAGAFMLAFLAHEPVLILTGRRGARALAELSGRARLLLGIEMAGAALAAAYGFAYAATGARLALVATAALAAWRLAQIFRHAERRLAAELSATLSLCLLSIPVGLAAGLAFARVSGMAAIWCVVMGTAVLAVQGVIARGKHRSAAPLRAAALVGVAALAVAMAAAALQLAAWRWPWALLPALAMTLAINFRPPQPRHLRPLGWTVMGTAALTLALLV